ncbi:MAG: helix-turn-helix domain-containing protein [Marinomonas sp.]
MLVGIKLRAHPTPSQKQVLSQWMGCARVIWNAKVDEEKYYRTFARRFCVVGTYAPIDTKTAQFKSKELTPWLSQCPSQILRNSAVNWYKTYQKFMKGVCGRPKRKPKTDRGSIYLTRFMCVKSAVNIMCLSAMRTTRVKMSYQATLNTYRTCKIQQKNI